MVFKSLNIYKNEEKLNQIIYLVQSKTKIRSPVSIGKFKTILNKVLIHLKTDINTFENIKKEDIDYNELINLVNPKHVCFIHTILIHLFNFKKEEFNKIYFFDYKKIPESLPPKYITTEELDLMYSKANDKEKLILYLFMSTGMRCCGMANIHSIDYSTRTFLTIEKYNKEIRYKIASPLIETLLKSTKYFDRKRNEYSIRKIITDLKIKCGLENNVGIHPHSFRHTFAKMCLYSGMTINNLSKILNHNTTKITETVYLKERPIDVINRIDCPFIGQDKFVFIKPKIWIDLKNNGY
jgi:integrase